MSVEITTGRGRYRLSVVAPLEYVDDAVVITLAMERADGIERIVTRCRIIGVPSHEVANVDAILERLKPRITQDFEQAREAALKAIRTERRLHEATFDLRT